MKNLGRTLSKIEQKKINGGSSRQEYCDSLLDIVNGDNPLEAIELAVHAFNEHCAPHIN